MKKIIILALAILPLFSFAQGGDFSVKVKIDKSMPNAKAFLLYFENDKNTIDSVQAKNGLFEFKGNVTAPVRATLILDHNGVGFGKQNSTADNLVFYIERGTIMVQAADSIKKAVIKDSPINTESIRYNACLMPAEQLRIAVNKEFLAATPEMKSDKQFMELINTKRLKVGMERRALQVNYIKANPNSYLSLLALKEVAGMSIKLEIIDPLFKGLSAEIRNSNGGKAFAMLLNKVRATSPGAVAPDFVQNDANGSPVKLSDFRGKYVLLDFWASWCGPCREENPYVVKAYRTYKDRNFTVLGVSLDKQEQRSAWLQAIEKDGLIWPQVSDLQGWKNAAATLYGVRGIPQNFLIDPNGNIIAINLRGELLEKKLAELIK